MADLIDRQAALDFKVSHGIHEDCEFYVPYGEVKQYLEQLPTAEPQIIRCKDCRYWDKYSDYATLGTCNIWRTNRTRKDYCSEARCKDG